MVAQCRLMSACINGVEAVPVSVEVSIGNGIPGIAIVGMGDTAVQEAKERVRSAIRASGFAMPNEKIVVNLAPGGIRKAGAGFDLPIALGILVATGQVGPECIRERMFVGELSLYGNVSCVSGDLAFCICASKAGLDYVSAPRGRAPIGNIEQLGLKSLGAIRLEDSFQPLGPNRSPEGPGRFEALDFSDVSGHECAKRAMAIAVAGEHGLLMVGPPGSGKTMLASRVPSIMPPLSEDAALEAAAIHSVASEDVEQVLKGVPPFRHPHHSATMAGLLGGGSPLRPGEASLAHNGVLFLDELAEFKPATLQGLRQPIEDGKICITRATGKVEVPSRFILIAATNPCPCGYFGDREQSCTCMSGMVRNYMSRIGGPLIDRFDMQLDIHRVPTSNYFEGGSKTSSADLRECVIRCLEFICWRRERGISTPIEKKAAGGGVFEAFRLEDQAKAFAMSMAEASKMSGRGVASMLKVSRTIADMDESEAVTAEHVAQAHAFRLSEIIGGR